MKLRFINFNPHIFHMLHLIIFDLDGVVIDSVRINIIFTNKILKHFGKPRLTKRQEKDAYTLTSRQIFTKYLKEIGLLRVWAYTKFVRLKYLRSMRLSRHMLKLLKWVKPRYKVAMATNRGDETHYILRNLKISKYFDKVLTADHMKHPKPNPEALKKLMKHFNVKPHEALYIGDTSFDSRAAKRAHVVSIIYKNKKLGDYHIRDIIQIKKIIREVETHG